MPSPGKDMVPAPGAFLFCGVFALYLSTLAPTVTFWDSGELITASHLLGITHQPGYPLYCLVGKASAFLPLGGVAYRLNLLSAVFAALTALVVYHALLALVRHGQATPYAAPLAMSLALLTAVSRTFWSQAVVAEVYTLNSFFLASLILMHVLAGQGRMSAARYVCLSGFVFGMGVVNHVSLLVYLPALALSWALLPAHEHTGSRAAPYLAGLAFVLLGLSVCLYLPVRSAAGVALDIGHPDAWSRFVWVVRWDEYAALARHLPGLIVRYVGGHLAGYAESHAVGTRLAGAALFAGTVAALLVCWRLFRRDWRAALPLLIFLAAHLLVVSAQSFAGARDDARFGLAAKFYIPALVAGTVLAGMALADLLGREDGPRFALPLLLAFALAAAFLVHANFAPNDRTRNFMAYDYAGNSLKSVGEGGVLLTWGDNGVFPLWYLRMVERYRDDAALVHGPLLTYGWYLEDVERALRRKVGFMPPYFLGENVYRIQKEVVPARPVAYDYSSVMFLRLEPSTIAPRGLVYYEGWTPPGDPWDWYVFRGLDDPSVPKGAIERNIMRIYDFQRSLRHKRG